MIYLVTRHAGAIDWLKQQIAVGNVLLSASEPLVQLAHLPDSHGLMAGDVVMGILPVNKVAGLNRLGVRYFHLSLDVPLMLRGCELSVEQLSELNARLEEYTVT